MTSRRSWQDLDRHLVFPLLEFIQMQKVYPEAEILEAKIQLLQKTNMIDFAADIYKTLHNAKEAPAEMMKRREEVIGNLQQLQVKAEKVVNFLSDPALVKQLRSDKSYNLNLLQNEHGIGAEDVDALFHYAKFQFECGNYSAAAEFLYHYRSLCTNGERGASALWGKFASGYPPAGLERRGGGHDPPEGCRGEPPVPQPPGADPRAHVAHPLGTLRVLQPRERSQRHHRHVFPGALHAEHPGGGAAPAAVPRGCGDHQQAPPIDA